MNKKSTLAANETASGKKTFTYGTNADPAVVIRGSSAANGAAIQIGVPANTGYSCLAFYRKCADDANYVNRGNVLINKDGTLKLSHRRAKTVSTTATADSNYWETATLLLGQNVLAYQTLPPGTPSDKVTDYPKCDIFYDTYETTKLNTTAKDLIGAINEVNSRISGINKDYIMSLIDSGDEVRY